MRDKPNHKSRIDWSGVPLAFVGKVSAVVRNSRDAEQLEAFYGSPAWVPDKPVLLHIPGNPTLIGLDADGQPAHMTARQLRDLAYRVMEGIFREAMADTRGLVMRERGGPVDPVKLQPHLQLGTVRQAIQRKEIS